MNADLSRAVNAMLANDEGSSDFQLYTHFVNMGCSYLEAAAAIERRNIYLKSGIMIDTIEVKSRERGTK